MHRPPAEGGLVRAGRGSADRDRREDVPAQRFEARREHGPSLDEDRLAAHGGDRADGRVGLHQASHLTARLRRVEDHGIPGPAVQARRVDEAFEARAEPDGADHGGDGRRGGQGDEADRHRRVRTSPAQGHAEPGRHRRRQPRSRTASSESVRMTAGGADDRVASHAVTHPQSRVARTMPTKAMASTSGSSRRPGSGSASSTGASGNHHEEPAATTTATAAEPSAMAVTRGIAATARSVLVIPSAPNDSVSLTSVRIDRASPWPATRKVAMSMRPAKIHSAPTTGGDRPVDRVGHLPPRRLQVELPRGDHPTDGGGELLLGRTLGQDDAEHPVGVDVAVGVDERRGRGPGPGRPRSATARRSLRSPRRCP